METIGIIGEGKMGSSLFHFLADFPLKIRWITSQDADVGLLQNSLEKKWKRQWKNGLISQADYDDKIARMIISRDLTHAGQCDLVIEAIWEDPIRKKELFLQLDQVIERHCILATNSSSILPSRLFISPARDPYIVGLHYFYPVQIRNIAELIFTDRTTEGVKNRVQQFLQSTGKNFLLLNEANAFILNKLFLDIQNEAFRLVHDGVISVPELDNLVKDTIFPAGIFEFMDQVGLDIMLTSVLNYTAGYPHQDYFDPLITRLGTMVATGKLGVRSGEGFYRYPRDPVRHEKKESGLTESLRAEIARHLKNTYLNSARRCTMQSRCTIDEMNEAIREYFGLTKGPFE
jgi:3-hydroxybutyryl-CoA dehydrogenase